MTDLPGAEWRDADIRDNPWVRARALDDAITITKRVGSEVDTKDLMPEYRQVWLDAWEAACSTVIRRLSDRAGDETGDAT